MSELDMQKLVQMQCKTKIMLDVSENKIYVNFCCQGEDQDTTKQENQHQREGVRVTRGPQYKRRY